MKLFSFLRGVTPSVQKTVEEPIFSEFQILELAEELSLMPQVISELQRLSTAFKKGEQPSPYRGSGFEYEESRLYQRGDEVRHLNWRLMARTGKAYSKLFQEERQERWMIVLDMRSPMRLGTRKRLKVTQGIRVAGYYAWLAQQSGFPLTAVAMTEAVDVSPIFEGKNSYAEVMHHLSRPCPPLAEAEMPNLEGVLQTLQSHLSPGMRLILISDFIDLSEQSLWLLSSLQSCVQLKMVQIVDVAELNLPPASGIQLQGIDGQQKVLSEIRGAYAQWAQDYFAQKMHAYQQADLSVKWLKTDDELAQLTTEEDQLPNWLKETFARDGSTAKNG